MSPRNWRRSRALFGARITLETTVRLKVDSKSTKRILVGGLRATYVSDAAAGNGSTRDGVTSSIAAMWRDTFSAASRTCNSGTSP